MQSSRNDTEDQPGNSKVPDAPGHGFVPPPGPPVPPVDPRSQLMGRACPFPPPSPRNICGAPPDYYSPPNDFPGPPRLPYPGRNVYPPRGFPPSLIPGARFFPRPPHPESRHELPSDLISPSNEPAEELQKPKRRRVSFSSYIEFK
ncbi:melanoma inhibitory activity protein 2-like [Peromyscus eremicus]|uniref:melanoma inhibitory activity protein 2-like n=1 Tax=Peromyscus eremicus TaxID=42410 RepID=UPI0027DC12C4|nr:melanoma inhibitory activity protein 2-like [Peromyscus eremicus]